MITIRSGRAAVIGVATVVFAGCLHTSVSRAPAAAASSVPGDWATFNRTLAGDRFSPLAEIDRSNVAGLTQLCTYTLPEVAALQAGPVVIGGAMYFSTDTMTYAIDAGTCAETWKRSRHSATPGGGPAVNRGVAYLDGKVFRGTSDGHVLAFDAKDGHTVWDVTLDVAGPGVTVPMAPIAWHGMVFIGNAGGDRVGVIGHVYALDAGSGRVDWKFDVVPAAGPARNTWGRGAASAYPVSGGAFWTSFTLDEPSGVLYVLSGNPAPDFDGAMRDGENLYANCLIALDAATGRMLGYNQLVKHDFHDWDVDSPSPVVMTRAGRSVVASANKDGLLSVLDRGRLATRSEVVAVMSGSGSPIELPLLYQMPTTTRENVVVPLSRDRPTRFCPASSAAPNGTARRSIRRTIRSSSEPTIGAPRCNCSARRRRCRGLARRGLATRPAASGWTRPRLRRDGSRRTTPRTVMCGGSSSRRDRCSRA